MTGGNLTVAQAAALLKVSRRRVVAMIGSGILEAEKFGEKVWQVNAESVEKRRKAMEQKRGSPKGSLFSVLPSNSLQVEFFYLRRRFIPLALKSFNTGHSGGSLRQPHRNPADDEP